MKSLKDRKLETLKGLIVEVYATDSELVYRNDVEFKGYYAFPSHDDQWPDGYYLGETLDDALETAVRAATEQMRLERKRRDLFNATHQIKR